jgi:integrase
MQTRFYIERRKDDSGNLMLKDRPVFMSVSFHGDRVMLSTGIKSDFHGWDPDAQRIKSSYPGAYTSNVWLDTLAETAEKAWKNIRDLPPENYSKDFRKMFQAFKPKYSTGFFDVFYLFLELGSTKWSTSTYRKVRTIYKHLREFEDKTDFRITFRGLDNTFLEKFKTFYAEKGNNGATTYKAVNIIVWFMNWATENGYNVNQEYRKLYKSLGQISFEPRLQLYLRWDELNRISTYHFQNRKLGWVRDLFCFMCFTGFKYTELQSLRKEDVEEDEVILRKPDGNIRRIPLNKKAKRIHLEYKNRYYLNNTAFPTLSIITFNKYLRSLGMIAGLDRMVLSTGGSGERVPLHEQMTAGIAVNTFIANALELEIPVEIISTFTGVRHDNRIRQIKMDLAKEEISKFDTN